MREPKNDEPNTPGYDRMQLITAERGHKRRHGRLNGETLPLLLSCRCTDFRQQLFSNGSVQCSVFSFSCAVPFDRDRVMTSTSMFESRNKGVLIFIPQGGSSRVGRSVKVILSLKI